MKNSTIFPYFLQTTIFFIQSQSHESSHTRRTKCNHDVVQTHGNHNAM